MKVLLLISIGVLVLSETSASSFPEDTFLRYHAVQDYRPQQETRTLLSQAVKLLNLIIDQAVKGIDKVQQDADSLLDDVLKQAEELLELATEEINKTIQDAVGGLNPKSKGPEECLALVPQRADQIAKDAVANAKSCFDDLVSRVKILRQNVKEHVEFFVDRVHDLQTITQSCVDESPSLIEQVKCLLSHVPDTNDVVAEILQDIGKLLAETMQESISLFSDTRGCLLDVVRQCRNDVDKLVQEVFECLQQQHN